jgi:hypothetical protein
MMFVASALAAAPELAVGGLVGQHAPQELGGTDTGLHLAGLVRGRWTEVWGAELTIGANPHGPVGDLSLVHFLGEPSADLVPHVALGVGIQGDRRGFATVGGGFDIALVPWLELRAEGRFELDIVGETALLFAFAPVVHTRRAYDADGDGVPDRSDTCIHVPEDRDGHADVDGCPDPDNDADGIADTTDRCADLPEDLDGNLDKDGCPDPDDDEDGVVDGADGCPDTPEDLDQFEDLDGCPDVDNDRDFVRDEQDRCPDAQEDGDEFDDDDGCPDPDNDGDGFADRWDDAPLAPETYNRWRDDDGVPDAVPPVVVSVLGPVRVSHLGVPDPARLELLAKVLASFPAARVDLVGPEAVGIAARDALLAGGAAAEQLQLVVSDIEFDVRLSGP